MKHVIFRRLRLSTFKSSKTNMFSKLWRFSQRHLFIFTMHRTKLVSAGTLVITGLFSFVNKDAVFSDGEIFKHIDLVTISDILFVLSAFTLLGKVIQELLQFRSMYLTHYKGTVPAGSKTALLEANIPEVLKQADYKIFSIDGMVLMGSEPVNQTLFCRPEKYIVANESRPYQIIDEAKAFAPFLLGTGFRGKIFFNEKKIRLRSDLLPIMGMESAYLSIQETDYFSTVCTNDVATSVIRSHDRIGPVYDGKCFAIGLLPGEGERVFPLMDSPCSNHMGGSTMMLTRDRKLVFFQQTKESMQSGGRIVPSSSGSFDWADYVNEYRHKKSQERLSNHDKSQIRMVQSSSDHRKIKAVDVRLTDIVVRAMNRELVEECGLDDKDEKRLDTRVVGYTRSLDRGGKPDFFCATLYNGDSKDIRITEEEKKFQAGLYLVPYKGEHMLSTDKAIDQLLGQVTEMVEARRYAETGERHAVKVSAYVRLCLKMLYHANPDDAFRKQWV